MRKFFWITFILALVVALAGYWVINRKAKSVFETLVNQHASMRVTVKDVHWQFPSRFVLSQLAIKDVLKPCDVFVEFDWTSLSQENIEISRLYLKDPFITINQTSSKGLKVNRASVSSDSLKNESVKSKHQPSKRARPSKARRVTVQQIEARDGTLQWIDPKRVITIENVMLTADKVEFSSNPKPISFEINGSLGKENDLPFLGDQFMAQGWINWPKRDMNATVTVGHQDQVSLKAQLASNDNDLRVQGELKLGMGKKAYSDKPMEDLLLGVLTMATGSIATNFSFQTKMDRVELSNISVTGSIGSEKSQKPKKSFKDLGEQFKVLKEIF